MKLGHSYTLSDARTSKELLGLSLFAFPVGRAAGEYARIQHHSWPRSQYILLTTRTHTHTHTCTHKTSHICQTACLHDALADLSSPTRVEMSANPHCSWISGWLEAQCHRRLFSRVLIYPKPHSSPEAWITHWSCPW